MAQASGQLHEDKDDLSPESVDMHRAIVSLMEELEAVDWYDQRAQATADPSLRAVLEHNRDEEKEHAAMALEWIRRHDPTFDAMLRTYLFSEGDVTAREEESQDGGPDEGGAPGDGSLGIGSLRARASR